MLLSRRKVSSLFPKLGQAGNTTCRRRCKPVCRNELCRNYGIKVLQRFASERRGKTLMAYSDENIFQMAITATISRSSTKLQITF